MSATPTDLHGLDPLEFIEHVHSFEFWFQSVESYLSNRPYGHDPDRDCPGLGRRYLEAVARLGGGND